MTREWWWLTRLLSFYTNHSLGTVMREVSLLSYTDRTNIVQSAANAMIIEQTSCTQTAILAPRMKTTHYLVSSHSGKTTEKEREKQVWGKQVHWKLSYVTSDRTSSDQFWDVGLVNIQRRQEEAQGTYGSTAHKVTIHQVTTMLANSKNVLFPGPNHLLTSGRPTDDPTLWLLPERQCWW